jgi:hypothetical protein
VQLQRPLHDLDGAVDTGAETTGIGEQNLHGTIISQPQSREDAKGDLYENNQQHRNRAAD